MPNCNHRVAGTVCVRCGLLLHEGWHSCRAVWDAMYEGRSDRPISNIHSRPIRAGLKTIAARKIWMELQRGIVRKSRWGIQDEDVASCWDERSRVDRACSAALEAGEKNLARAIARRVLRYDPEQITSWPDELRDLVIEVEIEEVDRV